MMECPRCKFVQPVDRFCANCGLNVEAFAAKPKPLSQRLLGNPIFYVVVAVISGFVLVQVVKKTVVSVTEQKGLMATASAPVANNNEQPAAPPVASESPKAVVQNNPTPTEERVESEPANLETSADETSSETPTDALPAVASTPLTSSTTPPAVVAPPAKPPAQLDLIFYEIGRESWVTLANEGKPAGEQNGWRALAFTNRDRLQATLVNARRLPGGRQLATQASSTAALHFQIGQAGIAPNQIPLGLFVDMSVIKMDGVLLELEVDGQVDLRHENNQETHQKAGFVASFSPVGALIINGMIPRKNVADAANHPTANTPLSALESPDFTEGQSEVVLVIQGK